VKGTNRPFDRLLFLYSCPTSAKNYKEKKRTVFYPYFASAIRPVPHTEELPVPVTQRQYIVDSDDEPTENRGKVSQPSTSRDADFTADFQFNEFHRITQKELNYLIWDLDLLEVKLNC